MKRAEADNIEEKGGIVMKREMRVLVVELGDKRVGLYISWGGQLQYAQYQKFLGSNTWFIEFKRLMIQQQKRKRKEKNIRGSRANYKHQNSWRLSWRTPLIIVVFNLFWSNVQTSRWRDILGEQKRI